MKQHQIIFRFLEDAKDWVPSYDLIKNDTPYGWLGTSADREARRMAEEGKIERKREGKYTYYRIPREQKPVRLFDLRKLTQ